MSIRKYIPNAITAMNLVCGVLATVVAMSGDLRTAGLLIVGGALFDFMDGFVARLLHVSSKMGKELDSLADNITFGFAPAVMYSSYLGRYSMRYGDEALLADVEWLSYVPLVLTVFAALRLAKFNIDERQTENFLGLTTTATGLFTAGFFWMEPVCPELFGRYVTPCTILTMVAVFCFLLVSEIPMFSLKIKHWTLRGNELRFILVAIGLVSMIFLGLGGLSLTIAAYVLFSVVRRLFFGSFEKAVEPQPQKRKRWRQRQGSQGERAEGQAPRRRKKRRRKPGKPDGQSEVSSTE